MQFRTMLLAAAGAMVLAGGALAQQRIPVGHLMDNSGPTSDVGVPFGQGVADALAWVNRTRNGIAGRQLAVSGFDYGYQAPRAIAQYQSWVQRERVVAIQGWGTVDTEALITFVTRDRIPYISGSYSAALTDPTGRAPRADKAAPFNFFYGPSYSDALRAMITWAAEDWKARGGQGRPKYVHMGANHPYPNSPKAAGEALAAELGFEVLPAIQFTLTPGDFTAQCLTLRNSGANYAYLGNTAGSNISVLRACQTAGVNVQFLGNVWGMDENAMKAAGTAANGVVFPVRTAITWSEILADRVPTVRETAAVGRRGPEVEQAIAAIRAAQDALARALAALTGEPMPPSPATAPAATAPQAGYATLREISRGGATPQTEYRPVHYLAGVCSAMIMVEAMEWAAANGGQVTGERIRDGFYARRDWVPAGFEGVCNPSTFTNEDHRGQMTVSLYRAVVTGDTTQGSVAELMRAGTMRLEPVTTITLERRQDWLGW
ncbi:MAG: ABC transporter substrate-binding protein [Acetobacteraceae bacterium]